MYQSNIVKLQHISIFLLSKMKITWRHFCPSFSLEHLYLTIISGNGPISPW